MTTCGNLSSIEDRLNEAYQLHQSKNLAECENRLRDLYKDPALPRYHLIKTLIMLAAVVQDEVEANRFRLRGETIWGMVRHYHPVGSKPGVDRSLGVLRGELDVLKTSLAPDEVVETTEQRGA